LAAAIFAAIAKAAIKASPAFPLVLAKKKVCHGTQEAIFNNYRYSDFFLNNVTCFTEYF